MPPNVGGKGRILIIDDDPRVRSVHERILERAGYDVRSLPSPYEGLEATRDWTPALILLDLVMPTVSGFEAVKVFKYLYDLAAGRFVRNGEGATRGDRDFLPADWVRRGPAEAGASRGAGDADR